jgi:hypothetical protein
VAVSARPADRRRLAGSRALWQKLIKVVLRRDFPRRNLPDASPIPRRCSSSVVEHSLGKGEVESSILSCSTILFNDLLDLIIVK